MAVARLQINVELDKTEELATRKAIEEAEEETEVDLNKKGSLAK